MPHHVADDAAVDQAARTVRDLLPSDMAVTAEAPVVVAQRRPTSGLDRLTDEARAGIERSARPSPAAIGSPVLTIHLFIPQISGGVARRRPVDLGRRSAVPRRRRRGLPARTG